MKQIVYRLTKEGYIEERYVAEFDEAGKLLTTEFSDCVFVHPMDLYKPKWTGAEWIEGATQEEIDEMTKVEPSPPSDSERIDMLEETIMFMLMGGGEL